MKGISKTRKLIGEKFVMNEKERILKYESEKRSSFGI